MTQGGVDPWGGGPSTAQASTAYASGQQVPPPQLCLKLPTPFLLTNRTMLIQRQAKRLLMKGMPKSHHLKSNVNGKTKTLRELVDNEINDSRTEDDKDKQKRLISSNHQPSSNNYVSTLRGETL